MLKYTTTPKRKNYLREEFISSGYTEYIDIVDVPEHHKEITKLYISGVSQAELGKRYNLTGNRIHQIVFQTKSKIKIFLGNRVTK